ncbi:nitrite reductase small subunit NirD [Desertimonas flava]|uniref:nitrite reductase small subunit NirD n=1 Tax=Desertimonas flava TaxID=2064846 RepID=UPI000E3410EC|nr:nitrite reductase small subunit NirD [Desertimonas flava]
MTVLDDRDVASGADWVGVCEVSALIPDRGVAALVDGHPVAVFLLSDGSVHAIDNDDPCSGAGVLSRGIVGDVDGVATVASPLYKQRFELSTGRCLDAEAAVTVHRARIVDAVVEVRVGDR